MTHIFIGTPSYKNTVSVIYLKSLLEYTDIPDLTFSHDFLHGDSLITRARNKIITDYYNNIDVMGYTHLFWQDDDIYVSAQSLYNILEHNLDIVSVAVPLKMERSLYGVSCAAVGAYEKVKDYLYKVKYVGNGALLLSNKAIKSVIEHCNENNLFYYQNDEKIYNVFQTSVSNGLYLTEDYFLCQTLTKLGYDIHIDSSSDCFHTNGIEIFKRTKMPLNESIYNKGGKLMPDLFNDMWVTNDYEIIKRGKSV